MLHALQRKFNDDPESRMRVRRMQKRATNVAIILVVSLLAAFIITRQSGGAGFSISHPSSNTAASNASMSMPDILAPSEKALSADASEDFSNGYKLEPGPMEVAEVASIVLHDAKRNKDVPLRIFYPTAAGKYPVIVFSHGAGGSQSCCESLTRHWASYGYVTLQPTHDDSIKERRNGGEALAPRQGIQDALKNPVRWESRPQDISFVIDSLAELQKRIPGLADKLAAERIGVGGHSMGAYTAEAIGGASVDLPNHPGASFFDSRVRAILALSPQGPGQFGLTENSFGKLTLPFMGVTGSLDSLGSLASPGWHRIPFERSQPGNKVELFIEGARHSSFVRADTPFSAAVAPQATTILGYTNAASLAFWDAYLKDHPAAKGYLQSDELERFSHGSARLSRR
jgi:predicted dienelactone hydrolase